MSGCIKAGIQSGVDSAQQLALNLWHSYREVLVKYNSDILLNNDEYIAAYAALKGISSSASKADIDAAVILCKQKIEKFEAKHNELKEVAESMDPAALAPILARLPQKFLEYMNADFKTNDFTKAEAEGKVQAAMQGQKNHLLSCVAHGEAAVVKQKRAVGYTARKLRTRRS